MSWRYSYWLLVFMSVVVLILSYRLTPIPRQRGVEIDVVGVALSASAIALILFGLNNLQRWGPLLAKDAARFSLLRLSPAPLLILLGIVLVQAFFAWSHRRVAADEQPLLAMEVLESKEEKSAVIAFLVAGSLGLAVGFLIPLYVQIVQDRTPLASAVAILPYALAVTISGVISVRTYDRLSPRRLEKRARRDFGEAGAGGRCGNQRGRPAPRAAGVVLDHRQHLVVGDLPGREIAEVCAGRVVGR